MTMLGLLKSGKLILRCANDLETRCNILRKDTRIPIWFLVQSVVNEVMFRDRPGRPDIDSQEGAWFQQFVFGNVKAELELSVESRSFLNRVNDQVRKRQKRISNVTEDGEEHSLIW